MCFISSASCQCYYEIYVLLTVIVIFLLMMCLLSMLGAGCNRDMSLVVRGWEVILGVWEKERERESSFGGSLPKQLQILMTGLGWNQGPELGSPKWVAAAKVLGPVAGSWVRSRAFVTWKDTPRWNVGTVSWSLDDSTTAPFLILLYIGMFLNISDVLCFTMVNHYCLHYFIVILSH